MTPVSQAVILMAGSGSRLRGFGGELPKPLIPILDRPLISYTINALVAAGVSKIIFIVGYERERLIAAGKERVDRRFRWSEHVARLLETISARNGNDSGRG